MPRKPQPARLKFEAERVREGRKVPGVYVVRDYDYTLRKPVEISTGCGKEQVEAAEQFFERYLAEKRAGASMPKYRPPEDVLVADVIALYTDVRVINWRPTKRFPKPIARPKELMSRLNRLLDFFGEMSAEDVDIDSCEAFADYCESPSAAKRALEDLRSAMGVAFSRKKINRQIHIELPEPSPARTEFLDRAEVAKLLKAAWRKRRLQVRNKDGVDKDGNEKPRTEKHDDLFVWRHLTRFILTAVYTGTRKNRIWNASFVRMPGRPFIDLEKGLFYRMAAREKAYTKKLAPPILIPPRLLAHMRRWREMGATYLCEYHGEPADPSKALRALIDEVLPKRHEAIVIHTFRHTAASWLLEDETLALLHIADFLGMSLETLNRYGHSRLGHQRAIGQSLSSSRGRISTVERAAAA